MDSSPEKQEYLKFMHWFQNAYPDLYVLYWQSIVMSKNGSGITVMGGNPDKGIIEKLNSILKQYYLER